MLKGEKVNEKREESQGDLVQEAEGRVLGLMFHGTKRVVEHHQKENVGRQMCII